MNDTQACSTERPVHEPRVTITKTEFQTAMENKKNGDVWTLDAPGFASRAHRQ